MNHRLNTRTRPGRPSRAGRGRAGAGGGSGWSPLEIPGLIGWWDASDADSFTFSSGTTVSQWNDLSGAGLHFTQSEDVRRPTRNSTVNGLGAILFDGIGASKRLDVDAGSDAIDLDPWTLWFVADADAVGGDGRYMSARRSATGAADYQSPNCIPGFIHASNGSQQAAHCAGTISAYRPASGNTVELFKSRMSGTHLFVSTGGVETAGTAVTAPALMRYLRIFDMCDGVSNPPDGGFAYSGGLACEIILANANYTDTDVDDYLNTKWGLV